MNPDQARTAVRALLGPDALSTDLASHSWLARSWVHLLVMQLSGRTDVCLEALVEQPTIDSTLEWAFELRWGSDGLGLREQGGAVELWGMTSDGTPRREFWLETVEPRHAEPLYSMAVRSSSLTRWRYRGQAPTPEHFQEMLFTDNVVQAVAYHRHPVAHVVAYDLDLQASMCKLGIVGTGGSAPGAFVGVVLFLRFLFSTWPLERVVFEVPAYNLGLVEPLPPILSSMGIIEDYTYWDGRLHDVYYVAISRSAFLAAWGDWSDAAR